MRFLIPQPDMKLKLVSPHEINVQNDTRSSSYLRFVAADKASQLGWIPPRTKRKERQQYVVEVSTHFPAQTVFKIKSLNSDFAVLNIVSSPILLGCASGGKKSIVVSTKELFKLNFRQE